MRQCSVSCHVPLILPRDIARDRNSPRLDALKTRIGEGVRRRLLGVLRLRELFVTAQADHGRVVPTLPKMRRRFLTGGVGSRARRPRRRGGGGLAAIGQAGAPRSPIGRNPSAPPGRRHPRISGAFPLHVFRIFSVRGSGGEAKALDLLASPRGFEPLLPP